MSSSISAAPPVPRAPLYRTIWRWHFYAGLFCIPFVLWLSLTGMIYLFKPQYENWREQPYRHLHVQGELASPEAQVEAALKAVPGTRFNAYELPHEADAAPVVIVGRDEQTFRVYIHPQTLQILGVVNSDSQLMAEIFQLHGRFMLGDRGSALTELAASWAIIMLLTGLYLWWPRGQGLAGVLYPRFGRRGRPLWRDLHAVTGFWISLFALFLLLTGLPWTHLWGSNFRVFRAYVVSLHAPPPDWTTSRREELAETMAMNRPVKLPLAAPQGTEQALQQTATDAPYAPLDLMVPTVSALALPPPVRITPPSRKSSSWRASSLTQNRPQRVFLTLDAASGAVVSRKGFENKPMLDQMVSVGVAAHEGQLFGWPNQLLGVVTALGLMLLSVSGLVMWLRRRPAATLGALAPLRGARVPPGLMATAVLLGLFLPLFGISMVVTLLLERLLLRRIPTVSHFLGLTSA